MGYELIAGYLRLLGFLDAASMVCGTATCYLVGMIVQTGLWGLHHLEVCEHNGYPDAVRLAALVGAVAVLGARLACLLHHDSVLATLSSSVLTTWIGR